MVVNDQPPPYFPLTRLLLFPIVSSLDHRRLGPFPAGSFLFGFL